MKKRSYSMDELRTAWNAYTSLIVFRMMENGVWKIVQQLPPQISATRAERVRAKDIMSFPSYLEDYHA